MANDKDFKIKNGLTVDSDTLVVDAGNSRVGIGTTNPATPFEVYGSIRSSSSATNHADFNGLSGALYISHRNGADDGAIIFGGTGGGTFTERMRLSPDGKLGIGTSAPATELDVTGTITADGLTVDTDTLYVDATNDRVGIGTSSPVAQLDVKNGTTYSASGDFLARIQQGDNSTGKNGLSVMNAWAGGGSTIFEAAMGWNGTAVGYYPVFTVDGTGQAIFSNGQPQQERMRINSSGKVLIDRTTAYGDGIIGTPVLQARARSGHYAAAAFVADVTSSITSIGFVNPNGLVGTINTSGSSTSYNTSSDYRLKENVVDLTGAIDRLKLIPVHRFNFITDSDTTVDGFLAHEVQPHVPEAVTGEKDAVDSDGNIKPQGIDQSKLVPLLTAAIKEQQTQIEALEARLAALESA